MLLGGASLVAGAGLASAASAQQGGVVGGQAEWAQSYDAGAIKSRNIQTASPILSPETAQATENAIRVYQDLMARGGHAPALQDRSRNIDLIS